MATSSATRTHSPTASAGGCSAWPRGPLTPGSWTRLGRFFGASSKPSAKASTSRSGKVTWCSPFFPSRRPRHCTRPAVPAGLPRLARLRQAVSLSPTWRRTSSTAWACPTHGRPSQLSLSRGSRSSEKRSSPASSPLRRRSGACPVRSSRHSMSPLHGSASMIGSRSPPGASSWPRTSSRSRSVDARGWTGDRVTALWHRRR